MGDSKFNTLYTLMLQIEYICSLIIMFSDIASALLLNIKSICGSSFTAGSLRLCLICCTCLMKKRG